MAGKPFSRQEPCPGSGQPSGDVPSFRHRRATCGTCGRSIQRHQDGTFYDHVRVYTINYPTARYDGRIAGENDA